MQGTQQELEQKPAQEQEQDPSKMTVEIKMPSIIETLSGLLLPRRARAREGGGGGDAG